MRLVASVKKDGSNVEHLKDRLAKYSPFEGKSTVTLLNAANNILYNWGRDCPNYIKAVNNADYGNEQFNQYPGEYIDKWQKLLGFYPERFVRVYHENDGIYEYLDNDPRRVAEEVFHELELRGIIPQKAKKCGGKKIYLLGSEYTILEPKEGDDCIDAYTINIDGMRSHCHITFDTLLVVAD